MGVDAQAAYAWQVRGLGGIINMLEREFGERTLISPYWQEQLNHERARLDALCQNFELRATDGKAAQD